MPDPKRLCGTCLFWMQLSDQPNDGGLCRRNAPRPRSDEVRNAFWPLTWWDEFCGDWQPKAQRQETDCRSCKNLAAQIQVLADRLAAHGEKP